MSSFPYDFYRCPTDLLPALDSPGGSLHAPGFFLLGEDLICYGPAALNTAPTLSGSGLADAMASSALPGGLPFNPTAIRDCLVFERYPAQDDSRVSRLLSGDLIHKAYYRARQFMPTALRTVLQRFYLQDWRQIRFPKWPVDTTVDDLARRVLEFAMRASGLDRLPFVWFWPAGAHSALCMTHDVESQRGLDFVPTLIQDDRSNGIQAAYQFIPEGRYKLTPEILTAVRNAGCEVNLHGLDHEGDLFRSRAAFEQDLKWINDYLEKYQSGGFRSPCMYRNADMIRQLKISYDMSIPNVAHLEPQRGGCCTTFPFFNGDVLEIPLTMVQDYSLFHVLGQYSIELWLQQMDIVLSRNGIISFNVHPDYIQSEQRRSIYSDLLQAISQRRQNLGLWVATPGQVNDWWRLRQRMSVVREGDYYRVAGPGSAKAAIGLARFVNGTLDIRVMSAPVPVQEIEN